MNKWVAPAILPRHVAIVMDGNGRWAKRRGLPRVLGHRKGVEALRAIVRESGDLGIEVLSLYAFSTENWKRSTEEVGALMGLLLEFFIKETNELHANNVKVRILGEVDALPKPQQEVIRNAIALTRDNTGLQLNLAINYGGRNELVRAVRALAARVGRNELDVESIDEAAIAEALDTAGQPDVDLLIRPSGEQRLSNFLLYQSAYAEFFFPDILWPDFDVPAYHASLEAFANRDRRFGRRKSHEGV